MTERRAILNEIESLQLEIREHYRKVDLERMHAEAKEAGLARLHVLLDRTARKPKVKEVCNADV